MRTCNRNRKRLSGHIPVKEKGLKNRRSAGNRAHQGQQSDLVQKGSDVVLRRRKLEEREQKDDNASGSPHSGALGDTGRTATLVAKVADVRRWRAGRLFKRLHALPEAVACGVYGGTAGPVPGNFEATQESDAGG